MTISIEGKYGGYWVRIRASNFAILAHSETYVAKSDAIHCARLIIAGAGGASFVDNSQ